MSEEDLAADAGVGGRGPLPHASGIAFAMGVLAGVSTVSTATSPSAVATSIGTVDASGFCRSALFCWANAIFAEAKPFAKHDFKLSRPWYGEVFKRFRRTTHSRCEVLSADQNGSDVQVAHKSSLRKSCLD